MANMNEWAQKELDLILEESDGDMMQSVMNEQVMEIIELFSSHGHSGTSASYAISVLSRLLTWKPLTSLTGDEDEWKDCLGDEDGTQQNLRCSAVFRRFNDNSTAFNVKGKIFSDDGGKTWFTNGNSHVPIEFPYWVPQQAERIILRGK